ncbi:hypothetical protein [Nocardia jejuensis]|uniref:hypothetical protein n=1 Tax=Nocardia jejuensis TaxID=328049 RepID=UPI000AF0545A|nr:hypothetical protein [Nocardia jejuensis]
MLPPLTVRLPVVFRALGVVLACLVTVVAGAPTALGDGVVGGADLMVAQSLGDRELTLIVHRAQPVPGPLRVDVVTHSGSAVGTLTLGVAPTDRAAASSSTTVQLTDRAGPYPATLRVEHAGPWELSVSDGERTARIPFLVAAQVVTPWERAAYGGFFAAGGLLLAALATALISRRSWPALIPVAAMIAALTVGVTGATLSSKAPQPRPAGSLLDPTSGNVGDPYPELGLPLTTNYSRPPANLAVSAERSGTGTELRLSLTDSATGRPVDDLLVNDDALVHLMIVGPSGTFWHRHPIRTAPGEYRIRLDLNQSGEYAVAAELARRGGGVQLLRSSLRVTAENVSAPGSSAALPSGVLTADQPPGPAQGAPAAGTLNAADLVAGEPGTLTAQFGGAADLQPWLGMLGHLIAVGPLPDTAPTGTAASTAPVWAHAHAMLPARAVGAQAPDETVAAYGPDIAFTFTFPLPGRYLVWAQAERGYTVLTLPATLDVRAAAPR